MQAVNTVSSKAIQRQERENLFLSGTFLRFLVVVGVLGCAVFAGFQPNRAYLLLAAPLVPLGFILLTQRPQLGLAALIVGSLAIPFGLGTGSESKINTGMLVLAALLAIWFLESLLHRTLGIANHPTTIPLIAFLVIAVIAFFTGQLTWFPKVDSAPIRAQLGGLGLFFLSAAAFWLGAFRLRQLSWLKTLTYTLFGVGAFWVFGYLFTPTRSLVISLFERGSSGATGSVFWVWLVGLALGQALLNHQLPKSTRVALLALVAASLYMTLGLFREWTSGWLPTVCTLAIIVWFGLPRYRPLLLAGGIAVAVVRGLTLINGVITEGSNQYSFDTRVAAALTLWELIQHNPLLGFGPANYYFYTPLFNILGYNNLNFNSHNNYVDIVAETGFLGLAAFAWFAWVAGRYTLSVRNRVPEGFPRAYAISAFACWVGTLVSGAFGDWFLPFVYNIGFTGFRASILAWLFLGGVVALDRLSARKPNQQ